MDTKQIIWMQCMTDFSGSPAMKAMTPQSVRMTIPTEVERLFLTVSNEYGTEPLSFEGVKVRCADTSLDVLFDGSRCFTVGPGQTRESDEIRLSKKVDGHITVDIQPQGNQLTVTCGSSIDRTMVSVKDVSADDEPQYYYGIKTISAKGLSPRRVVCFFGDSLTNQGRYSGEASRLLMESHKDVTVCNCGISGNRLLHDGSGDSAWTPSFGPAGVNRFEKDVSLDGQMVPSVVFVLIGVNDLYQAGGCAPIEELPTAAELIAGLQEIQEKAARLGSRVLFGTLTPFKRSISHEVNAWTPQKELVRQEVNEYLRGLKNTADIDEMVRDTNDQACLDEYFDCGDHLHFSALGGKRIGSLVFESINRVLAE